MRRDKRVIIAFVLIAALAASAGFLLIPASPVFLGRYQSVSVSMAIAADTPSISSSPAAEDNTGLRETVIVYIPSADYSAIEAYPKTLSAKNHETGYEAAVREILAGLIGIDGTSPAQIRLLSISSTDGIASVNLTGNTLFVLEDEEIFAIIYCITNTLTEFDTINHVNFLINSKAASIEDIPYGTLDRFTGDMQTEFWQISSRIERMLSDTGYMPPMLPITLYYGSPQELLLGEVREVPCFLDTRRMLPYVIKELSTDPRGSSIAKRLLPADAELMRNDLVYLEESDGRRLIIEIGGDVFLYFTRNHISPDYAVLSIAMTLFDFYPRLEYVTVVFPDGNEPRRDIVRHICSTALGTTARLYFPLAEGGQIQMIERAVLSSEQFNPETLKQQMFTPPDTAENARVIGMMPPNTSEADIISISQGGGMSVVNVSMNFLQNLREMPAGRERLTVYSIVNTLWSSRNPGPVLFLVEGEAGDNVPGRINLSEPLYYNPGIIAK